MWKLFLPVPGRSTTLGVLWVFPTSLTWTLSQLADRPRQRRVRPPGAGLPDRPPHRSVTTAGAWSAAYAFLAVTRSPGSSSGSRRLGQVGFAPRNPFVLAPNDTLACLFGPVALVGAGDRRCSSAVVVGLGRHWQRASPVAAPLVAADHARRPGPAGPHGRLVPRRARSRPSGARSGGSLAVAGRRARRASCSRSATSSGSSGPGWPGPASPTSPSSWARRAARRPARRAGPGAARPVARARVPGADRRGLRRARRAARRAAATPATTAGMARLERDGEPARGPRLRPGGRARGPGPGRGRRVGRRPRPRERAARGPGPGAARGGPRVAGPDRRGGQMPSAAGSSATFTTAPSSGSSRWRMRLDQARADVDGAAELIDATTVELLAAIREVRDLARGRPPADPDRAPGWAPRSRPSPSGRRSRSRSRRPTSASRRRSRRPPTSSSPRA